MQALAHNQVPSRAAIMFKLPGTHTAEMHLGIASARLASQPRAAR